MINLRCLVVVFGVCVISWNLLIFDNRVLFVCLFVCFNKTPILPGTSLAFLTVAPELFERLYPELWSSVRPPDRT